MRSEKWRQWGSVFENWVGGGIGRLSGVLDGWRSVKCWCVAIGPRKLSDC